MAPSGPVAVTGLGAVSAFGWSAAALWDGLRAGRHAIGTFSRFDASPHRTHLAAEVPPPSGDAPASSRAERHSWADRFALAAALEAVAQSGLDAPGALSRAGVFFGSSTGGMYEGEEFFATVLLSAGKRFPISLLAAQQYNGPGDAVARRLKVGGPVETVSSACSSGSLALGAALQAVRRGDVEIAIAGAADSLCRITYGGFNALRSIDPEPCSPFRARRLGLTIGEGAGCLVLEPLARARARGAPLLALVCGAGASCDAHHMTAPEPSGSGAARAVTAALRDAAIEPDAVAFVNAHGTGTPLNDAAEASAIATVFGARASRVPLTSTKSLLGHLLGAAGALEAVATIQCLDHGLVHAMPEAGALDATIPLDVVVGDARPVPGARYAVSVNLAFGGANAAVVLARAGGAQA